MTCLPMLESTFRASLARFMKDHPSQRYGQAVFNLMHLHLPQQANRYRSTEIDPFYHDDRAQAFIAACFVHPGEE